MRKKKQMRKIACLLAFLLGMMQPYTVWAAENGEKIETEENGKKQIAAFEQLSEDDSYFSCMYKPSLEELLLALPETLSAETTEGESIDLEVTWECEEDFDTSEELTFLFYPKWDTNQYILSEQAEVELPSITVEVPAGLIPNLEEAQSALEKIAKNKDILALVYLCDTYDVKKNASYESETAASVKCGQSVLITGVDLDENGAIWYQITFYLDTIEYKGYIEKEYLATSDENMSEWEGTYINLSAMPMLMELDETAYPDVEQFPASYQNALLQIKEIHPNWIFVKMDTGLDWNTVISKELGDKSLVHTSNSGSWQNGYYGQGWSYASEGILKYCIDPRNFLTETGIFQFEQLTYNESYHTTEAIQEIIKNSFMASTIPEDSQTYSQAFRNIGKKFGVSPFHLASRVLQEQGAKGTSPLISGTYKGYEGYYNYFNVGASGTSDAAVITNGLARAKKEGWNTRYKSLEGGASTIGVNYIRKGQDTLYLEKFNVSNGQYTNFTHQYMQNILAPSSEAKNVYKAYKNAGALNSSFVFKIPLYKNMPASACSKPDTTDSLTLDKTAINSLEVDKTTKIVPYINGAKLDNLSDVVFTSNNPSIASVDGQGKIMAIAPGSTSINCSCKGANTVSCSITVVKAAPSVTTPVISPITYKEGMKLSDISLPSGWTWEKGNTVITAGTAAYTAIYTPSDTTKYNTVSKTVSFTVTKAVPSCQVPDKLETKTGTTLGSITLPNGFTWESNIETELTEAGEYTFYASYNPDKNSYYTVENIPILVKVTGSTSTSSGSTGSESKPSTSIGSTSTGSTSTSSGSTGSESKPSTSTGSTSTGSESKPSTSSGSTSTGSESKPSTSTGSTSTGSESKPSTSNGSTSTGSESKPSTSNGSTSTGSESKPSTSTGSTSTGSTSSSGSTGSESKPSTSTGSTSTGSTSSGGNTGSENKPSTSTGSTSTGSTSSGSTGSENKPSTSTGSTSTGSESKPSTNTGSASTENTNITANNQQNEQTNEQNRTEENNTSDTTKTENVNSSTNGSMVLTSQEFSVAESKPDTSIAKNNTPESDKTSTNVNNQKVNTNNADTNKTSTDSEVIAAKPSVTIEMDDTTILTADKLEMAKQQNFVLTLNMGNQAKWKIDTSSVDLNTFTALDMGISFADNKIPLEMIDGLAEGNEYLQFSLAHDGAFGFECVLSIALNPEDCGRYANLFYYNPETKELEFICDSIIDAEGNATFIMNHASDYVIIISDQSMAGLLEADGNNHMIKWIIGGVLVLMLLVVVGYGIFFYREKKREEKEEEDAQEPYNQEEIENPKKKSQPVIEKEMELESVSLEKSAEEDWIEDEEWEETKEAQSEPEMIESENTVAAEVEISGENSEDDWIDDDEWDIGNDWIDDEEWEKKNRKD